MAFAMIGRLFRPVSTDGLTGTAAAAGSPLLDPWLPVAVEAHPLAIDATSTNSSSYNLVVDVSAKFAGGDVPSFTLDVDGVAESVPLRVNTSSAEPIAFSLNLTNGVAHSIQIVGAAPDSPAQLLTVQDIRLQNTTITATSALESYVAAGHAVVIGNGGALPFGGQIDFNLPASDFGASTPTATPAPAPVTAPANAIMVGGGSAYTTIQQGIRTAESAGDHSVLIAPGTYSENDTLGAADNGLTLSAVAGAARGSVILAGSLAIDGASGITVSGLALHGDGSNIAIEALNSTAITVTDDSFTGTGQAVVLDGTTHSTVSDNLMTTTTASAIEERDGANVNTVASNEINGDTASNTVGAIWLHGANDGQITNNQISNTSGAGISLSDFYGPGTTATQNNNTVIADNVLSDVDTQSSDSGAIYVLGRSQDSGTGIAVKMNFISSTGSPGAHAVGIYLDDNASGVSVTQNIIQASSSLSDVFEIHGGSNDLFAGNIFDLGQGSTSFGLFQQDEANEAPEGSFHQLMNDSARGNVTVTESSAPRNPGFSNLTGGLGDAIITANDYWAFSGVALNVGGSGTSGDNAAHYVPPASTATESLAAYGSWSGDGIGFQAIKTAMIGLAPTGAHPY